MVYQHEMLIPNFALMKRAVLKFVESRLETRAKSTTQMGNSCPYVFEAEVQ
jgi:hypothetical protein